jgi:hypothetical protein
MWCNLVFSGVCVIFFSVRENGLDERVYFKTGSKQTSPATVLTLAPELEFRTARQHAVLAFPGTLTSKMILEDSMKRTLSLLAFCALTAAAALAQVPSNLVVENVPPTESRRISSSVRPVSAAGTPSGARC